MSRIKQVIKALSICNNIELIGSNSNDQIVYKTDFDLQEICDIPVTKALKEFQNMIKKLTGITDTYIVDFKAGIWLSQPLRWNKNEIMNGFKHVDNQYIRFENCLYNKKGNKVKIDLIVYNDADHRYEEMSCNYYFGISDKSKEDILLSLMSDIKKYYRANRLMKMLKRVYSYRLIKKEDVSDLIDIFNSKAGFLNQIVHHIDVILMIQESKIIERENHFKLKLMISRLFKTLPDQFKKMNDLKDMKRNLNVLINQMVAKLI
jgi:hypothetical protein